MYDAIGVLVILQSGDRHLLKMYLHAKKKFYANFCLVPLLF